MNNVRYSVTGPDVTLCMLGTGREQCQIQCDWSRCDPVHVGNW